MDLSAFSNDNFDAKEWINTTFNSPDAQKNKEQYATNLVLKLQLMIQKVNSALEDTAQQVLQSLPRVLREVETMRQEAQLLQEQMKTVKEDFIKVERDSTTSMKNLLKIDTVKSRMQEANKALREADNWTTLSSDVEQVFESGAVSAIAGKLIGMQNSLEILVDVPDYKERCQQLEELKNRLEAMLSPPLVAAFNVQSVEAAQSYVKIFRDIKRLPELQKCYHKCQKEHLLQQWRQIVEIDPDGTITDWLNNFYDILSSTWHSQTSWLGQVFLDLSSVEILSEVMVDVLSSLEPSLHFCIKAALKQQDNPLLFLIDLKQITDRFARGIELAITSIDSDNLQKPHTAMLAQTLYAPYRPLMEKYASLEGRLLRSKLSTINFEADDLMDLVQLLGESTNRILNFAEEAENRCQFLTRGCSYPDLIEALKDFFAGYTNKVSKMLQQLKPANTHRDRNKYLTDSWMLFQHTLHSLQFIGEFFLQLENFEQALISHVRETIKKLGYSLTLQEEENERRCVNPFHSYVDLFLTSPMKNELRELVTTIQSQDDVFLLNDSCERVKNTCAEAGQLAFDIVFDQIKSHLSPVPTMEIWKLENPGGTVTLDLPVFSLSPQEYITQIGQYLMTLPQHIEPFALEENPALHTALKHGKLPYTSEHDTVEHVADYLVGCLARGTMEMYVEKILEVSHLTPHAIQQLIIDIEYLIAVVEDLGLSPSENLQDVKTLLRADASGFTAAGQGKQAHLVSCIRSMRGIE